MRDYFEQQTFNALERSRLEPPDYEKTMQAYDDYADNEAWIADKKLEWESDREKSAAREYIG